MHATRDTQLVIKLIHVGGRVMRGVRLLVRSEDFCWVDARPWRVAGREDEAVPAVVDGLTSWEAGNGRHGGARVIRHGAGGGAGAKDDAI
jgi:hypothetical protein